jgi:hypothetical protein
MPTVSLDTSISVPEDVIFRELDGEAIILDLASGTYFGLDEVGTRLWMLLTESSSIRRVVEVMAGEYVVESAQLERDVLELVSQLVDRGLVKVNVSTGSAS